MLARAVRSVVEVRVVRSVVGKGSVIAEGAEVRGSVLWDRVKVGRDAVVESSKVGVRKPEPRFYEIACDLLGVQPIECVFLDDLGVNLKPARAMGMTTIKVDDPKPALAELGALLELDL